MFQATSNQTNTDPKSIKLDAPVRRLNRNDKALLRTAEWDGKNHLDLRLEEKVSLADVNATFLQGLVVYVGRVHFAEGTWVGIQLTGPSIGRGNCDGVVKGKKYFADVGKNNGIMAPAHKVTKRIGVKTGDPKVDAAQQKRMSEQARLADLEFIDALCQTRALAMLKIHEEKQKGRFAGLYNKEEAHIARLKQYRYAELLKSRGVNVDSPKEQVKVPEPNLKYAPRDSPLQQCDLDFAEGIEMTQQNFCLSDPTLPDNPITFASQAFLNMTGYNLNEILGKNCRFLQGKDTDAYAVYRIRLSIQEGSDCHVVLLNYRKDGTPFYNRLFMTALRDTKGRVKNYLGVQCEVSKEVALRINQDEKIKLETKLSAAREETSECMSERCGEDNLMIDPRKAARRKQRRSGGSSTKNKNKTMNNNKSDHSSSRNKGLSRSLNSSAPNLMSLLVDDSTTDQQQAPSMAFSSSSSSSSSDNDNIDNNNELDFEELVKKDLADLTEFEVAELYAGW